MEEEVFASETGPGKGPVGGRDRAVPWVTDDISEHEDTLTCSVYLSSKQLEYKLQHNTPLFTQW